MATAQAMTFCRLNRAAANVSLKLKPRMVLRGHHFFLPAMNMKLPALVRTRGGYIGFIYLHNRHVFSRLSLLLMPLFTSIQKLGERLLASREMLHWASRIIATQQRKLQQDLP